MARQHDLKTDPFDLQGYLYFQDQNGSQQDTSAVSTEREVGNPLALRVSEDTVTETEQKSDAFAWVAGKKKN